MCANLKINAQWNLFFHWNLRFQVRKTLIFGINVGSELYYARVFDYRGTEYTK